MTTIAWDGKVFACDKQMTLGNQKSTINKLIKIDDLTYVTYCGTISTALKLIDIYKNIHKNKKLTKSKKQEEKEVEDEESPNSATLVIFNIKDNTVSITDDCCTFLEVQAPYTCGSGGDASRACLLMGGDAVKSIEIASKIDCFTGMGVTYIKNGKVVTKDF